jgi:hypothetical protein
MNLITHRIMSISLSLLCVYNCLHDVDIVFIRMIVKRRSLLFLYVCVFVRVATVLRGEVKKGYKVEVEDPRDGGRGYK